MDQVFASNALYYDLGHQIGQLLDLLLSSIFLNRQHWFISRLDGASVTAGGFTPRNSNILVISTSSNQVYAIDVDAKQLGEWSTRHKFTLPRSCPKFCGEVIGLTFPPSLNASSVIVYSPRFVISPPAIIDAVDPCVFIVCVEIRVKWNLSGYMFIAFYFAPLSFVICSMICIFERCRDICLEVVKSR